MDLKDYLSNLPRGTHGDFAAQIGIDKVYLSQIASRKQGGRSFVPSPALAVRIEQATQAQVTRRDLRPDDWQQIWPELAELAQPVLTQAVPWDGITERRKLNAPLDRRVSPESVARAEFVRSQRGEG